MKISFIYFNCSIMELNHFRIRTIVSSRVADEPFFFFWFFSFFLIFSFLVMPSPGLGGPSQLGQMGYQLVANNSNMISYKVSMVQPALYIASYPGVSCIRSKFFEVPRGDLIFQTYGIVWKQFQCNLNYTPRSMYF